MLLRVCVGLGCKNGNGDPGVCIDPNAETCDSGITATVNSCSRDGSQVPGQHEVANV